MRGIQGAKILVGAVALIAASIAANGPAMAQQIPPYVYPVTLGTSSVSVLPANNARKKALFHNPNDQAKVAVCPIGPDRKANGSQALITAAINGAGCTTILPYQTVEITGGTPSGPQQQMPSAWVGIASAPGSALTILEWE
jgi:flavoprotein